MEKKKGFKVGDRVATYSFCGRGQGLIIAFNLDGSLAVVSLDGNGGKNTFHIKQLRKLIKKHKCPGGCRHFNVIPPPREIWVNEHTFNGELELHSQHHSSKQDAERYASNVGHYVRTIRFIESPKKEDESDER